MIPTPVAVGMQFCVILPDTFPMRALKKLIPRLSDFLNPVSSYQLMALWQRVHAVPNPMLRSAAF